MTQGVGRGRGGGKGLKLKYSLFTESLDKPQILNSFQRSYQTKKKIIFSDPAANVLSQNNSSHHLRGGGVTEIDIMTRGSEGGSEYPPKMMRSFMNSPYQSFDTTFAPPSGTRPSCGPYALLCSNAAAA